MSKSCEICGKATTFGRQKSHANNVSSRRFLPNVQTVKAIMAGTVRRIYACTRCIRSGHVVKAPNRQAAAARQAAAHP